MGVLTSIRRDLAQGALQLMLECRARLYSVAFRVCGNADDAEELVSQTLAKAIQKLDDSTEVENLYGWLKTMMLNLRADDLRHAVRRGTKIVEATELEQAAGEDWGTDEQILKDSDGAAVRLALRQLDDEYRRVVLLRYYEDFSLKEIAAFLNKPVGTVGRRLHVALHLLAGKLQAEFGKAKKPAVVLLALLFGAAALFGAAQTGLFDAVKSLWSGEPSAPVAATSAVPEAEALATPEAEDSSVPANSEDLQDSVVLLKEDTMKMTSVMKSVTLAAVTSVATLGLNAVAEELMQVTINGDDSSGNDSSMNGAGSAAGWSDGTTEATDPAKEYVVDGHLLRTPQPGDLVGGTYSFGGGRLTFKGTGSGFSNAGSKLTLQTSNKVIDIPSLYVQEGEALVEHGVHNTSMTVSGTDWTVNNGATLWFSAFYVSGDHGNRQLYVKANLAGEGTIRCAGEGKSAGSASYPGKIFFKDADNSSFTGAFTTVPHGTPTEPVEVTFSTATAWFGNPSAMQANGVTLSEKVKLIFDCSLESTGSNRGFTFVDGTAVISVAQDQTVCIDAPIVAPNGFIKQGAGKLVIASTGSSVNGNILVKEGTLTILNDGVLASWAKADGGVVEVSTSVILATVEDYEGSVDGDAHSPSCEVTQPEDGAGCTITWSKDNGITWSEEAPAYSTETNVTVRCRIVCDGYPDFEKAISINLWPKDNVVYVKSNSSGESPYDTPASATSLATALSEVAELGATRIIVLDNQVVGSTITIPANVALECAQDRRRTIQTSSRFILSAGASICGFDFVPYNQDVSTINLFALNDQTRIANCKVRGFRQLLSLSANAQATVVDCDAGDVTYANTDGRYIYVNGGTLTLQRTSVHDITYSNATTDGLTTIILNADNSSVAATECEFYGIKIMNSAGTAASILSVAPNMSYTSSATFDRCCFSNCMARHAFCRMTDSLNANNTSLTLKNCLLKDMCSIKPGDKSAQFFFYVHNSIIDNCTFVDCRASDRVFLPGENVGSVTVRNTIFKNMTATADGTTPIPLCLAAHTPATRTIEKTLMSAQGADDVTPATWYPDANGVYTDTQSGRSGKLKFAGENGERKQPYYTLASESFGRRMGNSLIWTAADKDLAGKPRLNGNVCDLGCYQCYVTGFLLTVW